MNQFHSTSIAYHQIFNQEKKYINFPFLNYKLLEWWDLQKKFLLNRIFKNPRFIQFCNKSNLSIDENSLLISDTSGRALKLARVTITRNERITHKGNWKFYAFFNEKIHSVFKILKAAIIDIILSETKVTLDTIPDLKKWLKKNWLEDFDEIKKYFF